VVVGLAGAITVAETRKVDGGSSRRGGANRTQAAAPDNSRGYQSAGIHNFIAVVQSNDDWDLYLGNLGRD